MCTVGVVRNKKGRMILFKNLDQVGLSRYPEPGLINSGHYSYLSFDSNLYGDCGVWAGMNECGLGLVGADGNAIIDLRDSCYSSLNLSLYAYRKVLSQCTDIFSGIQLIMHFYQDKRIGGNGDIVILADANDAVAIEYCYPYWGLEFLGDRNYMVRTNFYTVMRHLRPAPEDNTVNYSSALRYGKAFQNLSLKGPLTNEDDIEALLRDHNNGPSAMSICRHGGEGEYITLCSAIFTVTRDWSEVRYLINGTPCAKQFTLLVPEWNKVSSR